MSKTQASLLSVVMAVALACALALALVTTALAGIDPQAARTPGSNEPTIHEIYTAASLDHISDAEAMMNALLQAHPISGELHYVHAELLVKEVKLAAAKAEFEKAQKLAPGLPFAKPQAIAALMRALEPVAGKVPTANASAPAGAAHGMATVPFVLLLIAVGMVCWHAIFRRRERSDS